MDIRVYDGDRWIYRDLLLLADEQEEMIERYVDRGTMYVLDDGGVVAECIVTDEGDGVAEIQNIATLPSCQRRGYGAHLIAFVEQDLAGSFATLRVGTGESPLTLPFYHRCGFVERYRIDGFFLEHYDHPIFEAGVQLVDKVYLEKPLRQGNGLG